MPTSSETSRPCMPNNPLEAGLIPESLADLLQVPKREDQAIRPRIITKARVVTGNMYMEEVRKKDEEARQKEEEKQERKEESRRRKQRKREKIGRKQRRENWQEAEQGRRLRACASRLLQTKIQHTLLSFNIQNRQHSIILYFGGQLRKG